jgi:serine/threonine protein phosphatase PrpC
MLPRSCGSTDVGRRRTLNEDAWLGDDEVGVYFVADGMGGHAAGEVASREAVETAFGMVARAKRTLHSLSEPLVESDARAALRAMESAIQAATYMVYGLSELDREKTGMGTTMSGMLVLGDFAVIGQVGDSRIYQVREGIAEQITEDHTLINWQIRQGLITPEEARNSTQKNVITRAVGNREYVQVDTAIVRLEPGDAFLLCSDGLHGYLRQNEIAEIAALGRDRAIDEFIAIANDRGGRDNITAVLVEIVEAPPGAPAQP